jgi:hypothetical protein
LNETKFVRVGLGNKAHWRSTERLYNGFKVRRKVTTRIMASCLFSSYVRRNEGRIKTRRGVVRKNEGMEECRVSATIKT